MSHGGDHLIIPTEKMPICTSQGLQSIFSPGSKRTTTLVNEDGVVQINQYLIWPFDRSVEWKEAADFMIMVVCFCFFLFFLFCFFLSWFYFVLFLSSLQKKKLTQQTYNNCGFSDNFRNCWFRRILYFSATFVGFLKKRKII